jgi:hypothetical protein
MPSQVLPASPEQVLSELLLGATVTGIRFGALQLLLEPANLIGECYINLSSAWQVYGARPASLPGSEADVPELTEEQEILALAALRGSLVMSVAISSAQHLLVGFSSGLWLYVNGNNPGPEPWTAGLTALNRQDSVTVIAVSGSEPLVYWPYR